MLNNDKKVNRAEMIARLYDMRCEKRLLALTPLKAQREHAQHIFNRESAVYGSTVEIIQSHHQVNPNLHEQHLLALLEAQDNRSIAKNILTQKEGQFDAEQQLFFKAYTKAKLANEKATAVRSVRYDETLKAEYQSIADLYGAQNAGQN